jgi:DNA-dependent protein kinase catalytic subunit
MNSIFKEDPQCCSRDLNLKTFNVVPITNRLGSLEWVDNTEPMKLIINREHMRANNGKELHNSLAHQRTKVFLKHLPGNKGVEDIRQQHLALLMLEGDTCAEAFMKHKQLIQWSLLRQGLENMCLTSSAFITIKN